MQNVIDVNSFVRVFLAGELGDHIARGTFKQVGVIRTQYVEQNGCAEREVHRQTEAVIHDAFLGKLYAVEQYKGLAIRSEIRDEEMLAAMREVMPALADGEGFTYDQRIDLGVEDVDTSKALDMSDVVAVNDGTEGLDA